MNLILTSNGLTTGALRTEFLRMMGDDTNTKMFGVFVYKKNCIPPRIDAAPDVESISFGFRKDAPILELLSSKD